MLSLGGPNIKKKNHIGIIAIAIAIPMFEHADVWISPSNIGANVMVTDGCQGRCFSGCRGADELVRLSDPN